MKKYFLKCMAVSSVLLLALAKPSFSQVGNFANNWMFGDKAVVDFTGGGPSSAITSNMNAPEGCSSISNASGNLLFYTNGVEIYQSDNNPMNQSGGGAATLAGNVSTTQSSAICPMPGSTTQFYVFTLDQLGAANGLNYSIVDMSLNSLLGEVVTLNQPVTSNSYTEKMIILKHCNNIDYWLIVHDLNTTFHVFPITSAGIGTPINSTFPAQFSHNGGSFLNYNAVGYMKGSPDGRRIACAVRDRQVEVYNFNLLTGVVSNGIIVSPTNTTSVYYGVEFSPDSRYLYYSKVLDAEIWQIDLNALNPISSGVEITPVGVVDRIGALQLGPDGKIYVARQVFYNVGLDFLSIIDNPNIGGVGCNYIDNGITLNSSPTSSFSLGGLPNFIANMNNTTFFSQPITSLNSLASGENSLDIATDGAGNTYITGYVDKGTSFATSDPNNPVLTFTVSSQSAFFVAKFNSCGGMDWINYSLQNNNSSSGNGIAIDPVRNRVYVVGDYSHGTSGLGINFLTTAQVPGGGVPASTLMGASTNSAFVAVFDAGTGGIQNYYEGTAPQYLKTVKLNSLDILNNSATSTNVFIGGYETVAPNEKIYLQKLTETNNAFTTIFAKVPVTSPSTKARINDLEVITTRLYVTGEFSGTMYIGTTPLTTLSPTDGFKAGLSPSTMTIFASHFSAFANQATVTAAGTGVTIAPDNTVTFTGNYLGNVTSSPGTFASGVALTGSLFQRAYVCKFNTSSVQQWNRSFSALIGNVTATGITSNTNGIYVCGHWGRSILNGLPSGDHSGSPNGRRRIYNIELDPTNGNINWQNTTNDMSATEHTPSRIAVDQLFSYMTGNYAGTMQFFFAAPGILPLVSSNVPANNVFILRNEIGLGDFRSVEFIDSEDETDNSFESGDEFEIFPNPTHASFKVNIPEGMLTGTLSLYDFTGKLVEKIILNGVQQQEINLDNKPDGVYLIVLSNEYEAMNKKVVKN